MIVGYINRAMISPFDNRAALTRTLGAALALSVGLQCAMPSQAAAETWAVNVVQLDPASRDPGVMLHCTAAAARPLCSGDMMLFWYEKRQRVTVTAAIANGRLYVKFLLHAKDSGNHYLFAWTQRYLEVPLGEPTRHGGVYAQEVPLSEPPPHADEDWPDWLTNPRVIPYLNIAATLQLTFWREE